MTETVLHPSLLLAEQLDPDAVWEYNHPERSGIGPALCDASAALEQLICRPPSRRTAARIEEAASMFADCGNWPREEQHRARIVLAYMPLFERRIERRLYGNAMYRVHRNLGQLALALPHTGQHRGAYCEVIAHALGLRKKIPPYILFPGLVRETAAMAAEGYNFNHDGYAIRNANRKIPVEIKSSLKANTGKHYHPIIAKFYVRSEICGEARGIPSLFPDIDVRSFAVQKPPAEIADKLISATGQLIYRESAGYPLSEDEALLLYRLTGNLMRKIAKHPGTAEPSQD